MPRRTEDFRGLAQASRIRLLNEVQRHPGLLLRELAELTELHENTVRDHLIVLENEGLISRRTDRRGTRGRPPSTYHPVADVRRNPAAERRVERAREHGDLLRRMVPEAAAANLSDDALHQLDTLYEHFDDAGLQPDLDEGNLEVALVPCPYYHLLSENQSLVCNVHERLIHDVLAQVPGPVQLTVLEPFVEQHQCRVTLTTRGGDGAGASTVRDAGGA